MCGIVGYSGLKPVRQVLTDGLASLEYRGYDSAGVALWENDAVTVIRQQGRLSKLVERLGLMHEQSRCGIGHTRWATHGQPSEVNAHPHRQGRVTLVHNGIIENYLQLREELEKKGYHFQTQTDTEIAAALIDSCYTGSPLEAIRKACAGMEGAYAFAILFDGHPNCVYGVRLGSPLVAAVDETGAYLASDLAAILPYTDRYLLPEEGELLALENGRLTCYDSDLQPMEPVWKQAHWSVEQAQKEGYRYFMEKEIHEQPQALRRTISPRIEDGLPTFGVDGLPAGFFQKIRRLYITACGTALYCGMVGKALIEKIARLPVEVEVASEFRYRDPILEPDSAAVIISQSGETADSLAALRLLKARGIPVIAIVNVVGSSIAREADYCLYTYAGPEIAVATTKAYSVQVAMMYLIAILAAGERQVVDQEQQRRLIEGLEEAVELTPKVLAMKDEIRSYARGLRDTESMFYIGRGLDYSLALEGSLKLKEISYIHAEAYAAGELKHGTLALVTPHTPVVALATQPELLSKTVSNMREVMARGGPVLALVTEDLEIDAGACDQRITIPGKGGIFAPLLVVIVLQMIGFYAAEERGCDVDKPRNLAKSVTVE